MLDASIQTQLVSHFQKLTAPVELVATTDDTPDGAEIRALLGDLVALSPQLSWRDDPTAAARRPSFSVGRPGEPARVRFAGAPMGHEFTSLILAILQTGGVAPRLDDAAIRRIARLPTGLRLETFVSLSCHNCPEVVQALNAIAVLRPDISHETIDGGRFEAEVAARRLMGVPAVFNDGTLVSSGRATLDDLLDALGAAASASARDPYDVLVVGGGPAGAAAAIYAARKGIRVGLVAERFGGQVGDTLGIENLVSVTYTEGPKLVAALESHVRAYDVEVVRQRVVRVETGGGRHLLHLADGGRLEATSVVLAPGARWRTLNVPGEADYRTKGVAFCPHCDGPLFKGRPVAVVGGGNSGVEAAIDLAGLASHVTLLEFAPTLRADAVLQERLARLPNVTIIANARSTEVLGDGQQVTGLAYVDRASDASRTLPLAGIFVQIGLIPSTDWLRGGVDLTPAGEIIVDARGQTSVPGIFAAGDATTAPYKQIVIAMGDGAKAALAAFEHHSRAA
jgi:alkyl hydroperoxide reductase subunit F